MEHEEFIDQVLLAPSERARGRRPGRAAGRADAGAPNPDRTNRIASLWVRDEPVAPSLVTEFEVLWTAPELTGERQQLDRWLAAPPDKTLALVAQLDHPAAMPESAGPVTYRCPIHPRSPATSRDAAPNRDEAPLSRPRSSARSRPSREHPPRRHDDHNGAANHDAASLHHHDEGHDRKFPTLGTTLLTDRVGRRHGRGQQTDHCHDYDWRFLDRTAGPDNPAID